MRDFGSQFGSHFLTSNIKMLENQDLEPRTTELMVPAEGDGSQYRHQPTAVIFAVLRISFALTIVNALFWSTQWSTQMMSHQDEHCGCHQNVTP